MRTHTKRPLPELHPETAAAVLISQQRARDCLIEARLERDKQRAQAVRALIADLEQNGLPDYFTVRAADFDEETTAAAMLNTLFLALHNPASPKCTVLACVSTAAANMLTSSSTRHSRPPTFRVIRLWMHGTTQRPGEAQRAGEAQADGV
ncbi:hypothetical protein MSAN_02036700 [Mycena sanguinolenta]|uniref:Uncharacterized protein n=1 Tax=Mycena sanguinolenta TaxID=230812 RepID=A0A8H7CMW9_9AGAR|nr:hypothetical protein MSAN_02036700 [Mycena sanguinolenta]